MIYISFAVVLAVLTVLRHTPTKAMLFLALLIAAPVVYFDALSRPKLLSDEIRQTEEVTVLGYTFAEGVAVWYLLALPDVVEPRLYYENWSEQAARRVGQMQQAADDEAGVRMRLPFERSLEEARVIRALPQPAPPAKSAPPPILDFTKDRQ